jgi:threonine dehydrogenase-like Zn-dependent dehydrogenase
MACSYPFFSGMSFLQLAPKFSKSSNQSESSYRFHWFIAETGFDIITPDELKSRHTKDPNWGVDLVIDCSGYAPAMEEALTLINPGGRMCVFGITSPQARMR